MSYGTNSPWGLTPVRYLNGAPWNGQMTAYRLLSGYATNLFSGDPVTPAAAVNGTITIATAGHGAAANTILGAFYGVEYTNAQGVPVWQKYWAANTVTFGAADAVVWVVDDPMVIFNVQANANPGVTNAQLLRNVDMVAGAGSTVSGLSGWMLDTGTFGTDATRQLKVVRFVPVVDASTNLPSGAFNNVECLINNHYYKAGVASI